MQRMFKAGIAVLAVATAACSDGDPMGPEPIQLVNVETREVCEVISFDDAGLEHGMTPGRGSEPAISIFGNELTFSATLYDGVDIFTAGHPNYDAPAAADPTLFDTDLLSHPEDVDLLHPWDVPPGCTTCINEAIGNIMVLPDSQYGWATDGDYHWGGVMTISGFTGGPYYVKEFKAADDDGGEPSIDLYADATNNLIGASTGTGHHTLERVLTDQTVTFTSSLRFVFGTEERDEVTGSGGVDDIVICRTEEIPGGAGTRTPGYWKNDKKPWPLTEVTIGGTTYTRAEADDLMEHPTKKDKTYNMFEQLVATTLNLANGTDGSCISGVVAEANAWMALHPVGSGVEASSGDWKNVLSGFTMSAADIHATLDSYNNGLMCAPHED